MSVTGNTQWFDSSTAFLTPSTIPPTPAVPPTNTLPSRRLTFALFPTPRSAPTPITRYASPFSQRPEYRLIVNHGRAKTPGDHAVGPAKDQTDKGPIWDVTQNFRGFWYTPSSGAISIAPGAGSGGLIQPSEGTSWLNFGGFWGDKKWPADKSGQYCIGDQCYISDGPNGEQVARIDVVPQSYQYSHGSPDRTAV